MTSLNQAARTTGSAPSLPKNRIRGSRVIFTSRIGASSDLSPIARLGCGHVYDETASAQLVYPNGLQSSFTYDDLNRVTALNAGKASYNYQLDATGNRKQVTESSGRVVNWSYDNIYRLTNEAISLDPHSVNGSVSYGLDPVGNRLSQTSSLSAIPSASYNYDADDRILSTETYDNNGNTLVTGARTFTYDFENRLKTMTMNGNTVTIVYDGDGNRVAKTANGVTTQYLVDDLNPTGYAQVAEEVTGTTAQRTYTYGLQRISQNQLISSTWTPSFYGYDGAGAVRLLTDATGTVTDTYDYDAWGNEVNTTGSTPNVYLYRGEQYDPDLRLYFLRARYFNSLTGRFLSTDPAQPDATDPGTLHKYLYATADPVNRVDPTGRAGFLMFTIQAGGYLAFSPGPATAQADIPAPSSGACAASGGGPGGSAGGAGGSGGLEPLAADWPSGDRSDPKGGNMCGRPKCCWKVRKRPLKDMGATWPLLFHVYFYNVCTKESIGLGGPAAGPNDPVTGTWETGEGPGAPYVDVPDYLCDCVNKKLQNPGNPPKYCWGHGGLQHGPQGCMNCNAWATKVEMDCRNQLYNGARPWAQ